MIMSIENQQQLTKTMIVAKGPTTGKTGHNPLDIWVALFRSQFVRLFLYTSLPKILFKPIHTFARLGKQCE